MSTWFDYDNQAWVVDGAYQRCGHVGRLLASAAAQKQVCPHGCYGTRHEGEKPSAKIEAQYNPKQADRDFISLVARMTLYDPHDDPEDAVLTMNRLITTARRLLKGDA